MNGLVVCCLAAGLTRMARTVVRLQPSNPLAAKLTEVFSDRRSAAVVGAEYLKLRPQEADVKRLARIVSGSSRRSADLLRAEPSELKKEIQTQQREDFEKERVVRIQGWVLSETEARLCALAALV